MLRAVVLVILIFIVALISAVAGTSSGCPDRPQPGTPVNNPLDLYSSGGVLNVALLVQNSVDVEGFPHVCYIYMANGQPVEAPTLRVNPGDTLNISLTNNLQEMDPKGNKKKMIHMHLPHLGPGPADDCSGNEVLPTSTNIHFHGLNVPPVCHQDDVIQTVIETGETFQYSLQIPANEPPGLYWIHPHVHGNTTDMVNGGNSAALIIEGNNPITQGLNERVLIVREQDKPGPPNDPDANVQLTLNFEPAIFPERPAPTITVQPGAQEYWRLLNATSKQFLALQLQYGQNQTPQTFEVLAIDGVQLQTPIYTTTLNIPPAGRMEVIIPGLPSGQTGTFVTNGYDTGPVGDANNPDILAKLSTSSNLTNKHVTAAKAKPPTQPVRFTGLRALASSMTRSLYFSEQNVGTTGGTQFYLTVAGRQPRLFHMDDPPAIVTHVGAVEDWTIENHSGEVHAFHIHQIHFLVLAINGVPVQNPDLQDTIIVSPWLGSGPYPSVTLRMDFRDPEIAGTFVYHCHILDHEDGGMMAKIEVDPN